jgi:hypothetical protein
LPVQRHHIAISADGIYAIVAAAIIIVLAVARPR